MLFRLPYRTTLKQAFGVLIEGLRDGSIILEGDEMSGETGVGAGAEEPDIFGIFQERLGPKLAQTGVKEFDWLSIITAIMAIFQNCKPPTPAQLKRKGLFSGRTRYKAAMNLSLLEKSPEKSKAERYFEIDKTFEVVDESNESEVGEFIEACCN